MGYSQPPRSLSWLSIFLLFFSIRFRSSRQLYANFPTFQNKNMLHGNEYFNLYLPYKNETQMILFPGCQQLPTHHEFHRTSALFSQTKGTLGLNRLSQVLAWPLKSTSLGKLAPWGGCWVVGGRWLEAGKKHWISQRKQDFFNRENQLRLLVFSKFTKVFCCFLIYFSRWLFRISQQTYKFAQETNPRTRGTS